VPSWGGDTGRQRHLSGERMHTAVSRGRVSYRMAKRGAGLTLPPSCMYASANGPCFNHSKRDATMPGKCVDLQKAPGVKGRCLS